MRAAVAITAGSVLTHQVYRRWPDIELQQWVFYLCMPSLCGLFAWLLLQRAPDAGPAGMLWSFGCWVALVESAQVVGCGLLEFGNGAQTDLCIQALGQDGYTALACAVVAAVITAAWQQWRHRHGRA